MNCKLCNSNDFKEENGVIYCSNCGYVLQETSLSYDPPFHNSEPNYFRQNIPLAEKWRIHNLVQKYTQHTNSTLHQTMVLLGQYCNTYDLPQHIKYNAFELYKKLYYSKKSKTITKHKAKLLKSLLYISACNNGYFIHPKRLLGKTWRKDYTIIKKIKKELNITIKYSVIDIIHYIINTVSGDEQEKRVLLYNSIKYYRISKYEGSAPHKIAFNIIKNVIKHKNISSIQNAEIERIIYGSNYKSKKTKTMTNTLNAHLTY